MNPISAVRTLLLVALVWLSAKVENYQTKKQTYLASGQVVRAFGAGIIGNILAIVVASVALIVGVVVVARTGSSITGLEGTANTTFTTVFNGILNAFTLAPTVIIALIAAVIIGALLTLAIAR